MKNSTLSILLIVFTIIIFSCKKEFVSEQTVKEQETVNYPNFSKFNAGSYWVYQQYVIDTLGNETPTNNYDSCYAEADTIINGLTHHVINKPNPSSSSLPRIRNLTRDSLHYIVELGGEIVFSSEDFQTIFKSNYNVSGIDTIYQVIKRMANKNITVNTPFGTFVTSDYIQEYYYLLYPTHDNPRVMHKRYAENVGVVIETIPFFSSNPNYTERRLIRYHLN